MQDETAAAGRAAAPEAQPTLAEAFRQFTRIGLLSFGGPTAQIAVMHRILVDETKWLTEQRFLNALSFCMLLPGPEAMQLATYAGWRLHGVLGGLMAGLLFVLPGAAVILALAAIYAAYGNVPVMAAIFLGIKAAVLIIVVEALLRIARRALGEGVYWVIAGLAFMAIFFFSLPFPLVIALAALAGLLFSRARAATGEAVEHAPVRLTDTLTTVAIWTAIWIVPLLGVALVFGQGHVLTQLGIFFSKLAVVTFGGAYAVLAYMAQQVVQGFGWLTAGEMLDGLGLAETTPGPLILVTEFVGFLAAYRHGGGSPLAMGVAGAVVTLWATFAPCFLWIFAGAPFIERLQSMPRVKAALAGVTAAVVGVILNLAVWFALHVFFAKVTAAPLGPAKIWLPELATLDLRTLLLSLVSAAALLWLHWGIGRTLLLAAGLALAWHWLAPLAGAA